MANDVHELNTETWKILPIRSSNAQQLIGSFPFARYPYNGLRTFIAIIYWREQYYIYIEQCRNNYKSGRRAILDTANKVKRMKIASRFLVFFCIVAITAAPSVSQKKENKQIIIIIWSLSSYQQAIDVERALLHCIYTRRRDEKRIFVWKISSNLWTDLIRRALFEP